MGLCLLCLLLLLAHVFRLGCLSSGCRMKIVILDGHTTNPGDTSWGLIEKLGDLTVYPSTQPDQFIQRAEAADILITNKVLISDQVFDHLPNLKFISVLATGYNVIDIEAAKRRGIVVSNAPDYSTPSVAQHVFAGLLTLLNRPEAHHQAVQDGGWQRSGEFCFWIRQQTELAGKTMGIVGLGKIGRSVAKLADAFGMRVVAASRSSQAPLGYGGFEWLNLDQLFSRSDVISLHCPLTSTTEKMVNEALLQKVKPSAILINSARGALVDEIALADALNQGKLGGAFLDVVSEEPIDSKNPLLTAKNCLITPHLAWSTIEARERLISITAANVKAFLNRSPINRVA